MPYYEQNRTYVLIAKLDPYFKVCWCSDDKEKKNGISLLNETTDKVTLCTHTGDSEKTDNNESQPPSKNQGKKGLCLTLCHNQIQWILQRGMATVDDYIATSCVLMNTKPAKF